MKHKVYLQFTNHQYKFRLIVDNGTLLHEWRETELGRAMDYAINYCSNIQGIELEIDPYIILAFDQFVEYNCNRIFKS